jgi:hypothetical protein
MSTASRRKSSTLAIKSAQLALAVPQVVAHRVARMAMAGPALSERDRKEFELMVAEKESAFAEAWQAMAAQTVRANQALAVSMLQSFWSPASWGKPVAGKLAAQMQSATLGILGKGMAPIHRKATANARRLAGTKLR